MNDTIIRESVLKEIKMLLKEAKDVSNQNTYVKERIEKVLTKLN